MALVFDEEKHRYFLDGEELPSVSAVKKPLEDFSGIHPEVLAKAGRFGSAVHLMVKLRLEGTLDYGSLDEGLFGPLAAFEKFLKEIRPFDSPTGKLIDVKSRDFDRVCDPVQLAGYYQLWLENRDTLGTDPIIETPIASVKFAFAGTPDIIIPPRDGAEEFTDHRILFLGLDGRYKYVPAYNRAAWPVFAHLLRDLRQREATAALISSWRKRL